MTAKEWIRRLGLVPHPEGGHYREVYRAAMEVEGAALGEGFEGWRSIATAIYYLLQENEVSRLHRLRSDEVWHHYGGCGLVLHAIEPGGRYRAIELGSGGEGRGAGGKAGDAASAGPQVVIPAGVWFGATVSDPAGFALCGCTVSPGFDFSDFEMGRREDLVRRFPEHRAIIEKLTAEG
jgi:predicted cupin superfamily sugar epimerase